MSRPTSELSLYPVQCALVSVSAVMLPGLEANHSYPSSEWSYAFLHGVYRNGRFLGRDRRFGRTCRFHLQSVGNMYFEVGGSTFLQNLVICFRPHGVTFRRRRYSDLSNVRNKDFSHLYTVKGVKIDIPQSKVTPYFRALEKPILVLVEKHLSRMEPEGSLLFSLQPSTWAFPKQNDYSPQP